MAGAIVPPSGRSHLRCSRNARRRSTRSADASAISDGRSARIRGPLLKRRPIVWDAGVHLAAKHWVAGAGLRQFPRFLARYPGSDGPETHATLPASFHRRRTRELVGLVVLLGAIALALHSAVRDDRPGTRRIANGLSVGVLAFVAHMAHRTPVLTLSNQLWFAAVLGAGLTVADVGWGVNPGGSGGPRPVRSPYSVVEP